MFTTSRRTFLKVTAAGGLLLATSAVPVAVRSSATARTAQGRRGRRAVVTGQGYFPVVQRIADHRIAVVLRGGAPHVGVEGRLDIVFSEDEGRTWSDPTVVVDSPVDDRNPAFGVAPDGALVVGFWRTATYDDQGRYDETLPLPRNTWVTRSTDGGRTWSEPAEIDVSDVGWGSPYGKIVTLPDASMLMNIYGGPVREPGELAAPGENYAYLFRSTDAGQTWQRYSCSGPERFNETALLQLDGGTLLAAMRTTGPQEVWFSRSSDAGQTWDEPQPLTPPNVHPADLVLLGDGRILMTVGYRAAEARFGVRGLVSDHEGTFQWDDHFVLVDDATNTDCGYPSSVVLNDGSVLTVYYAVGSREHPEWGVHCGAVSYQP